MAGGRECSGAMRPGGADMSIAGGRLHMSHSRSLEMCVDAWAPRAQGWVGFAPGSERPEEGGIALSLAIGPTRLGGVERTVPRGDVDAHCGYEGSPKGFDISLAAIAIFGALMRRTGVLVAEGGDADAIEQQLPPLERPSEIEGLFDATLGLTIVDMWFATSRRLVLRYEGALDQSFSIGAFQSPIDISAPVIRLPTLSIGTSGLGVIEIDLINPFLPLLIVRTCDSDAIIGSGVLPFPSFARGGLHYAEARWGGIGGEGLKGVMRNSARLVRGIFDRRSGVSESSGFLDVILFDPSRCAGTEPIFDRDLIEALEGWLGVPFMLGSPDRPADENNATLMFREKLRTHIDFPALPTQSALVLPGDAVPTFAALLDPLVADPSMPAGLVTSSYLTILDGGHEIWLVDPIPLTDGATRRDEFVPAILGAEGRHRVPACPAAIRTPPSPTRLEDPGIFAMSLDAPGRLEKATSVADIPLSILIASSSTGAPPVDLFQSLAGQAGFKNAEIIYSAVGTQAHDVAQGPLNSLFHGRHRTIVHAERMSYSREFCSVAGFATHRDLILLGAETILHDPLTLAILTNERIETGAEVMAATLLRPQGAVLAFASAGYFLREVNYRGVPNLVFDMPDARRILPTGYAVTATAFGAIAIGRDFLTGLNLMESRYAEPTMDELGFGIEVARQGALVRISTKVNVTTTRTDLREKDVTITLPLAVRSGLIDLVTRHATALQQL